jgi:hypothetical protein
MKAMRRRIALPKRIARDLCRPTKKMRKQKSRRDSSTARFRLRPPSLNQASVFFAFAVFLHCAFNCANCSAERIPFDCFRNVFRLSFVQPAFTHSACHPSIFVFWSGVRLSVARLTHAIESAFETPLAQHALSPENALDAISIATATRAVVVILIIVKAQTGSMHGLFNLFG